MPKSSSSRNPKSLPPSLDPDHLCEMLREDIQARIRVSALQMVYQIFEEEVEQLCGKPRSRKKGSYAHRAGSDKGSILLEGQRVSVRNPLRWAVFKATI